MTEMELLCAIGGVREEYIENAQGKPSRRGRKWLAVAACLAALVALSVTALALTDAGETIRRHLHGEVKVKGYTTENPAPGYIESGYELELEIDTVPESEITGEVLADAVATIRWQYQNYKPWDSWTPSHAQKQFDTEAEALEYVGYEPLKLPDLGWERKYVHVDALASIEMDHLSEIRIECFYQYEGMNIQAFATLYTEHYGRQPELHSIVQGDVEFFQNTYVTRWGTPCLIMGAEMDQSDWTFRTAYLVVDDVFYRLNISCLPEQEEAALALMYQWLDEY